jgi:transcriptional regulator with XRE-family HTH domain
MTTPPAGLGTRLRSLREERGWVIALPAEKIGIDASNLSAYERGRRVPTMATLARILEPFGLQFAIEFEPLFADLDPILDEARRTPPKQMLRRRAWLRWVLVETASVGVVVTGSAALLLHGIEVPVRCCDVAMTPDGMERLAAAVRRLSGDRWSGPWGFGFAEQDPREPGPLWWSVGHGQLKVEVVEELPRSVKLRVGKQTVRVVPLHHLQVTDRAAARLVARARQRLASAS